VQLHHLALMQHQHALGHGVEVGRDGAGARRQGIARQYWWM